MDVKELFGDEAIDVQRAVREKNAALKRVAVLEKAIAPFAAFGEVWLAMTPEHQDGLYSVHVGDPRERHITREHFQTALRTLGRPVPKGQPVRTFGDK